MGFANFSEEGTRPEAALSTGFDLRGLIFFNVMGSLLLRPWKLCILLWSASDTLSGPGRGAWFWKFAKPTSKTKHPAPALVE